MQIETPRLILLALTVEQLAKFRLAPELLAQELGISLSRRVVDTNVDRAITLKLAKLETVTKADHPWYSYWLIILKVEKFGAGLAGFKGIPNQMGEVEIGYGMDPNVQGSGYTSETVQALIDWAFQSPRCQAITATQVLPGNLASQQLLTQLGFHLVEQSVNGLSYRLEKKTDQDPVIS